MQGTCLHTAHLDKLRVKRQDVRIVKSEGCWIAFPVDEPLTFGPPAILVYVEGKFIVTQEKLSINTENRNGLEIFLPLDKV